MATNPFEDEDANYFVLINDEGQHSLWPVFADVPDGWKIIFGEDKRQACLDFIEQNWTDMRPNSLIRQMEADAAARGNGNGSSANGSSANGASTNGASTNGASTNGASTNGASTNGAAAKKKAPARKK